MFDVYISNWKDQNGVIHDAWTPMFTIPNAPGNFPIIRPSIKNDQTSAESFTFTMEQNSPYYDSLIQFKTLFCAMYDGDCIFFGR